MKIFTQNCYGPPLEAPHKKERFTEIADYVAQNHFDVVCLQEVFFPGDLRYFSDLHHLSYESSRFMLSGGLVTITRKQPEKVSFHRYTKQGARLKQWSDRFLGKGYLRVNLPDLVVLNTHLLATYSHKDITDSHLQSQTEQLLEAIIDEEKNGKPVLLAGDLNFSRKSPLYTKLISKLHDLTKDVDIPEGSPFGWELDMVLLSERGKVQELLAVEHEVEVKKLFHRKKISGSDHRGHSVEFELIEGNS